MIIYGFKNFKKMLGQTITEHTCPHCNNTSKYILQKITRFFTLFWIPIIPVGKKEILTCPVCEYGIEVNKTNKEIVYKDINLLK